MGGRKERKEEKEGSGKAGQDQDRHYQLDEGVSRKLGSLQFIIIMIIIIMIMIMIIILPTVLSVQAR